MGGLLLVGTVQQARGPGGDGGMVRPCGITWQNCAATFAPSQRNRFPSGSPKGRRGEVLHSGGTHTSSRVVP